MLLEEAVGAFQVAVLADEEVGPIKMWLEDNGYLWDAKAEPILMQYLAEGNVIAALKLRTSVTVADVHPITLATVERDLLRLTRIAAVENMDIRVFVLAEGRAAPTNYRHVLVNPLKIDWLNRATNYKEVIARRGGRVHGGRSRLRDGVRGQEQRGEHGGGVQPELDKNDFIGLEPVQAVSTLNAQNLGACYDSFDCVSTPAGVRDAAQRVLPPAERGRAGRVLREPGRLCGGHQRREVGHQQSLAAALLNRVIEPGLHGEQLIQAWPYLTRMYTTISPKTR